MNLAKLLLIARHEFWSNLRRPSFLFAVFGTPLIVALSIGLGFSSGSGASDLGDYRPVGVIDQSTERVFANQAQPEAYPDLFVWAEDEATARQQVVDGALAAYLIIPPDYVETGDVTLYSLQAAPDDMFRAVNALALANLNTLVELPFPTERIEQRPELNVTVLDGNRTFDGESVFFFTMLPLVFGFLLVLASMTTSSFLMNGLSAEKSSRIMEVLITSVRPMELLGGKVLGMGVLGLLQVVVFLVAGYVGVAVAQQQNALPGLVIPPDMAVLAIVYYVLSYFFIGAGLAAIGAVTSSEMEGRQFSALFILPVMLPYLAIFTFLLDPNGTVPTLFTLIPFTAPMAVLMRVGLTTVPAWQLGVSIGGLILVDLLVLWAAARLFRWGVLSYGKVPGWRGLWKIIRGRGDAVNVTPAPAATKEVA